MDPEYDPSEVYEANELSDPTKVIYSWISQQNIPASALTWTNEMHKTTHRWKKLASGKIHGEKSYDDLMLESMGTPDNTEARWRREWLYSTLTRLGISNFFCSGPNGGYIWDSEELPRKEWMNQAWDKLQEVKKVQDSFARKRADEEEERYSLFYVTMQDQGRTMSVPMLQPTSMTGTLPEITEWARDSEKNQFTAKYFALYAFPTEGGKVLAWISPNFKESDEGNTVSTAEGIRLEMKNKGDKDSFIPFNEVIKRSKTASEEERYTLYYATAVGHRNNQIRPTGVTGKLSEVTEWIREDRKNRYFTNNYTLAAFPTEGGKVLEWDEVPSTFLPLDSTIPTAEGIRLEMKNKGDKDSFIPYTDVVQKRPKVSSDDSWKAQSSGVVPICSETKRICLAWRSEKVEEGNCWGTLGGAVKKDMSPEESARTELQEETGYSGPIETHAAFVFKKDDFTYSNFIGVVDEEFAFQPTFGHEWENDSIEWFTLEEIEQDIKDNPKD
jgi:8-oxo-dGTP pyrophosphatase MutT (NUDIX family)